MLKILLPFWLMLPGLSIAQTSWEVDSSSVSFEIHNAGFPVDGTFQGFSAEIVFNPSDPATGMINASVDASTVHTGIRIRDKHLRKSDFLHAEAFPHITMKSESIQQTQPGQFTGTFELALKGNKQQILLPFSFKEQAGSHTAIMEGNFALNRHDYYVGGSSPILEDTVRIHLWARLKVGG